ncbi:MAG: ribonuclease P protein component [Nitrospira sp.]|jgi:ribonuclease P protein component|nr:ribonuclease P protein component [Nitrospira sp.]MBK9946908.1 ribonuclease P protein component [Nitrospira sp.]MBL8052125.1 ribonuclease P protein component [Nitrospira sp.]OYT18173.1 MAG: ribonuclease P protein component [Nitrospira sp. UW-LDO-01]
MGYDKDTPPYPVPPKIHKHAGIFLKSHREIQAVKQYGRRISTVLFNLQAYNMNEAPTRIGIVVGKRFGNAVRRNRAKRVFRELVRDSYSELVAGRGILVFPKKDVLLSSRKDLIHAWKTSLERMRLLRPD